MNRYLLSDYLLLRNAAWAPSAFQPPLPPHLPRHRSALHNTHDLAAELPVDHRPPRDKGELIGLLDHRELAAG